MAKLTLEDLRKLRASKRKALLLRETADKKIQIIVGMDTCGIAAGAKDVFNAFWKAMEDGGLEDKIIVRQAPCMGLCKAEPTVEVAVPGTAPVIYGNVKGSIVDEIMKKHVLGSEVLTKYVVDRPPHAAGIGGK